MRFSAATAVEKDGAGVYRATLDYDWSGEGRMHGGYLLAVVTRAAVADAVPHTPDPVAVSAQFIRPPEPGPAIVRTEVLKQGATVGVVRSVLEQDGMTCVEAMVNTGLLVDGEPVWADVPDIDGEPGPAAVDVGAAAGGMVPLLTQGCELRVDPATAPFLTGGRGVPRMRMWVRPRGEQPDLYFGLLAGDITVPTVFNLGLVGWAPTVQLTALLRARPEPGWLGVSVRSTLVQGSWIEEDATVTDSAGRIICQARQLALVPR